MGYKYTNCFNKIFNPQAELVLDPNKTALFVVDMQYFDAHPDWGEGITAKMIGVESVFEGFFAEIDASIEPIQQLLAAFRKKEMEVIHLVVSEVTKDSRDVNIKQLYRGLICPSNSREADPLHELSPQDDEIIIRKSSSGVFPVTNLYRILRNIGIKTLIMTGTSTGGCVESAVRDAIDYGFDIVLVSDACVCSSAASHELALWRMENNLVRVMTKDEVLACLSETPNGSLKLRSGLERVKKYLPQKPEVIDPNRNPYDYIFPAAYKLKFKPGNTALVITDTQRFVCDPALGIGKLATEKGVFAEFEPFYAQIPNALEKACKIADQCRQMGIPVIYVGTGAAFADGRDMSRKYKEQGFLPVRGKSETEFMPECTPQDNDMVLYRTCTSIFNGTGLDDILQNLGIENVILTGISWDGALEGSLRGITDRAYMCVIVPDACASYREELTSAFYNYGAGIIQVSLAENFADEVVKKIKAI